MPEATPRPTPTGASSHHVSTHTSSHTSAPHADHTPPRIPLPPLPQARTEGPYAAAAPAPDPSALRLLIADDNPVVRAGLTALLGGRADLHVVAEAADGRQALAAARQHRPDVVLLDVRMPGVDGLAALPYLVRIAPVVMLTYSNEAALVQEALRLGASGYLVHGEFTAEQLTEAVRAVKAGHAHFTASAREALRTGREYGRPSATCEASKAPGTPVDTARPYGDGGAPHPAETAPPVSEPSFAQQSVSQTQPPVSQSDTRRPGAGPAAPQVPAGRPEFGLSAREAEVMELIAAGMNNQQIAATCFISEKTVKNHINRIFAKLHSTSRSEAIAVWLGTARGRGVRGA